MEQKNLKKIFGFKDTCIWIGDDKFSQTWTGFLSLAVNVLRKRPKIYHMTKGDIFQIRVSLSDEKIWRKCSDVRLHDVSRKSQMKHPMTSQWYVTKFLKEISRVFNWQFRTENSDSEERISNLTLKFEKIIDYKLLL